MLSTLYSLVSKHISTLGFKFAAVALDFYTIFWLNSNLDSDTYKNYNLIMAYIPIVVSLIDFGIENLIQKFFTNHEEDTEYLADVWTTFNVVRFVTYFAALVIIVSTYQIFNLQNLLIVILLFSAKFLMIWDESYRGVAMANDKTWRFTLVDFATKSLFIIGLLTTMLIPSLQSILYFGLLSISVYIAGIAMDGFAFRKYTTFGSFKISILKTIAPAMGLLALTMILKSVYLTTDSFILEWTGTESGVINGYSEAYKLMEVFMIAPLLIMPAIASSWKKQEQKRKEARLKLESFLRICGLSIVLGAILYGILFIIGPVVLAIIQRDNSYPSAFVSLPILGLSLILFFLQTYLRNVLVLENLEKYELLANIITAASSILLYALIIPRFGFIGASWATVSAFAILSLFRFLFAFKTLRSK